MIQAASIIAAQNANSGHPVVGPFWPSMLSQCFGRRFRVSLVQTVGHSVSELLRQSGGITHLDLSVSGDWSANRPNKSPVCGVDVVGQCERNNREDEVGVLCEGEINGGSSNVRNMGCARDDECFWKQRTQRTLQCELGKLELHAREKFARVNACEESVLFNTSRYKRIAIS